jgi:three-Cys-motif partner protein
MSFCAACGQPLDIGNPICRACGEENSSDANQHSEISIDPAILDKLGEWSHVKHEIIDKYAKAYTTVLARQPLIKHVVYVDAFAGAGVAEDRETGQLRLGSALLALNTEPPFDELHFVEENPAKIETLRRSTKHDPRVRVLQGDANSILLKDILPRCRYSDFARGLCLLDPYGLTVDWNVLRTIGEMKSVEIFFNFMVVGANRNVLWKRPDLVPLERLSLMDRVWGDRSWSSVLYTRGEDLFGLRDPQKVPNEEVAEEYRKRLQKIAGFRYVPKPIPMKNTRNATVYYLFFASPNETGASIVEDIFNSYRQ